jgi:hypothetical protein
MEEASIGHLAAEIEGTVVPTSLVWILSGEYKSL